MPKLCSGCDIGLDTNHKFCSNCGTRVPRSDPSPPNLTHTSNETFRTPPPSESKEIDDENDADLQMALKRSLCESSALPATPTPPYADVAPPKRSTFETLLALSMSDDKELDEEDDYLLALELQREEEQEREAKLSISEAKMSAPSAPTAPTPNSEPVPTHNSFDVRATFNYTEPETLEPTPKKVLVKNARPLLASGAIDLQTNGFALVPQATSLSTADFYNNSPDGNKLREQVYYAEMESLILAHTGADKVFILADQIRNNKKKDTTKVNAFSGGSVSGYASVVHSDYCAKRSTQSFLRANGAPANTRYMLINAWRNIDDDNVIHNDTLACCDTTSVDDEQDFVRFDAPLKENAHCMSYKNGLSLGQCAEQYRMNTKHVDKHRWYYFPEMEKNEVLLFTQFDSDPTRTSRFTFHSAFHDSTVNQNMPARQSIEIRAMCDDEWGMSHNVIKNSILESIILVNSNDAKNIAVSLQMKLAVGVGRKILQPKEVDAIADAAALEGLEDIDVIINLCAERKYEFVLEEWADDVIREELERAKRTKKKKVDLSNNPVKKKTETRKKRKVKRCHHCGEPDSLEHHRRVHGHVH
ncbi:hypothetical protein TL16_g01009 [Triparma laevis f. inornata]|uniref:Uncharacterized protein n=1 Tax=Triparma laevis f. inornata TaxID=1714386 RepID=A0A9W6ZBJ9_9STRA|nr:hypothetical protein TL16_g01009 [Triparma laevis f. inornata]